MTLLQVISQLWHFCCTCILVCNYCSSVRIDFSIIILNCLPLANTMKTFVILYKYYGVWAVLHTYDFDGFMKNVFHIYSIYIQYVQMHTFTISLHAHGNYYHALHSWSHPTRAMNDYQQVRPWHQDCICYSSNVYASSLASIIC